QSESQVFPHSSRPVSFIFSMSPSQNVRGKQERGIEDGTYKREDWEGLWPSISLRDWSMQMSAPDFGAAKSKAELLGEQWLPMVGPSQMDEDMAKGWLGDWSLQGSNNEEKRNIVVADDARKKWLNSYMQKLLVVNSQ
uniref:Tuberoinfundibular peptide of 39 residues n=1 Tax=Oncorhynchus mykiss TaxID=8022 RepID=A0A8C7TDR3_ONCMY